MNCCKCTVFLHETDWVSAFLLKSLGMEFSLLNNWKLKMFLDSDYIHVYGKLFLGSLKYLKHRSKQPYEFLLVQIER